MSHIAPIVYLLICQLFTTILLVTEVKSEADPSSSIAINPERAQLLKDALGWMTFRKNGELLTEQELTQLFKDPLKKKYATSKFYRTFVIAFHQGVLTRLTLNENDACDPAYTSEFKDPFNNSVTWYYQKKFTFDSYDKRDSDNRKFCDYRQGLLCHPNAKKCQCPEGSSMQPISSSSAIKRCLLNQDEICNLIDIDHGNDPTHSALAANLYHLVFSLEKPISCKPGTQCRFKSGNINTPLCYDSSTGPWYPPPIKVTTLPGGTSTEITSWDLNLGDECTIGLYANPGSCVPGYVCYNFGPPRSTRTSSNPPVQIKIGFCFYETGTCTRTGDYIRVGKWLRPAFIQFVTPRTVPLRGADLRGFCERQSGLHQYFAYSGSFDVEVKEEGDRCTVSKTQTMASAWKYFADLEKDPPPGEDYVPSATKEELESNLQSVIDLTINTKQKVCPVYLYIEWRDYPALECVPESPPDADGNDGKCKNAGRTDTDGASRKLKRFVDAIRVIVQDLKGEETNYRKEILEENPEPPCMPGLEPLPSQSISSRNEGEVLEGGYCPEGSVCYQDFSESHVDYDDECKPEENGINQELVCHNNLKVLGDCEKTYLESKIGKTLLDLGKHSSLGKGEKCYYEFEKELIKVGPTAFENNVNISRYQVISWIERGTLCDRQGQNLECKEEGTCDCIGDKCEELKIENQKRNGVEMIKVSVTIVIMGVWTNIAFV